MVEWMKISVIDDCGNQKMRLGGIEVRKNKK